MNVMITIYAYLLTVNLLGFFLMGIDKWKAKKNAFRIPENTLFIVAIIGGSLGSILGMYLFRHKTRHWAFVIGMPVILVLQIALTIWVLYFSPFQIKIM